MALLLNRFVGSGRAGGKGRDAAILGHGLF
jgi:hypothetical protein